MVGFKKYEYVHPPEVIARHLMEKLVQNKQAREAIYRDREANGIHPPWGSTPAQVDEMVAKWARYIEIVIATMLPPEISYGFYLCVPGSEFNLHMVTSGTSQTEGLIAASALSAFQNMVATDMLKCQPNEPTSNDCEDGASDTDSGA